MNNKNELDLMLENFLENNQVEDNGFSAQVLSALPQQPRLLWLNNFYTVLGMLAGVLAAWKFDFIDTSKLLLLGKKIMVLANINISSISATASLSVLAALAVLLGLYCYEKISDI